MATPTPERLVENPNVRQRPDEGFRRWFTSAYFELIVWYQSPVGPLVGFQLCLSRFRAERAFTWTRDYASTHLVSESYWEPGVSHQSTGILHGDGERVSEDELAQFERESANLAPDLRELVINRIREYNSR